MQDGLCTPPIGIDSKQQTKPIVFIDYTPEYSREYEISNEIDRIPSVNLVRVPSKDEFINEENYKEFVCEPAMLKAKMPSPKQVKEGIAIIPIVLEGGKEILIKILDIRDILNDRTGKNHTEKEIILDETI